MESIIGSVLLGSGLFIFGLTNIRVTSIQKIRNHLDQNIYNTIIPCNNKYIIAKTKKDVEMIRVTAHVMLNPNNQTNNNNSNRFMIHVENNYIKFRIPAFMRRPAVKAPDTILITDFIYNFGFDYDINNMKYGLSVLSPVPKRSIMTMDETLTHLKEKYNCYPKINLYQHYPQITITETSFCASDPTHMLMYLYGSNRNGNFCVEAVANRKDELIDVICPISKIYKLLYIVSGILIVGGVYCGLTKQI